LIVLAVSQASAEDTPVSKGERLYDKNCSQCHGDNLQNNSGVAFDLRRLHLDEYSRFLDSVLHGKRAMPSWEGALTPEQIQNIWAYVRANAYQQ
jgi:mono/diheme cytochrome c family protein